MVVTTITAQTTRMWNLLQVDHRTEKDNTIEIDSADNKLQPTKMVQEAARKAKINLTPTPINAAVF